MDAATAINSADPAHILGEQIADAVEAIVDAEEAGDEEAAENQCERLGRLRDALAFTSAKTAAGRLAHSREAQRLCSDLATSLDKGADVKDLEEELVEPLVFMMARITEAVAAEVA